LARLGWGLPLQPPPWKAPQKASEGLSSRASLAFPWPFAGEAKDEEMAVAQGFLALTLALPC
jgi:hypothetical protein